MFTEVEKNVGPSADSANRAVTVPCAQPGSRDQESELNPTRSLLRSWAWGCVAL